MSNKTEEKHEEKMTTTNFVCFMPVNTSSSTLLPGKRHKNFGTIKFFLFFFFSVASILQILENNVPLFWGFFMQ